jgi:hypothetical protein
VVYLTRPNPRSGGEKLRDIATSASAPAWPISPIELIEASWIFGSFCLIRRGQGKLQAKRARPGTIGRFPGSCRERGRPPPQVNRVRAGADARFLGVGCPRFCIAIL